MGREMGQDGVSGRSQALGRACSGQSLQAVQRGHLHSTELSRDHGQSARLIAHRCLSFRQSTATEWPSNYRNPVLGRCPSGLSGSGPGGGPALHGASQLPSRAPADGQVSKPMVSKVRPTLSGAGDCFLIELASVKAEWRGTSEAASFPLSEVPVIYK